MNYVPGQPYQIGMPVITDERVIPLFRMMAFATFAGGENLNGVVLPPPPPGTIWWVDPDLLDLVAVPERVICNHSVIVGGVCQACGTAFDGSSKK